MPGRRTGALARTVRSTQRRYQIATGAAQQRRRVLVIYLALSIFGLDYRALNHPPRLSPSWRYLMGTDEIGHDYLALVLRGARQSMSIAFMSTAIGAVLFSVRHDRVDLLVRQLHRGRSP